ncbi:Ced12 family protein [Cryptosporidium ryanae]|uniref:Ced12 family protein n=1 Tax=Cryptosporidium ryanae TaxID=515981 RepID=UPI00351A15A7|nr:Ced12 family protein [Cryptosporidium ryanae]
MSSFVSRSSSVKDSFIPEVTILNRNSNVDNTQLSEVIELSRIDDKETFYRRLKYYITSKLLEFPKEKRILGFLRKKCQTTLSCVDPHHEQLFQNYWSLAYPNFPEINVISKNWKLLGFQSSDPRCEFKCGGLITLENMVYFAEQYRSVFKRILTESQKYTLNDQYKNSNMNNFNPSYTNLSNLSNANSPCKTPIGINSCNTNYNATLTPFNTNPRMNENDNKNFHLFLPKISESDSITSDLSQRETELDGTSASYPLSAVLINISAMICLYLNLLPNVFKIPGIPSHTATRRAKKNFIRLCDEFSFSAISELFCVCAIRFHSEWISIVRFLESNGTASEFDKALRNVQIAMVQTIESLPNNTIEFRRICNLRRYV